LVQGIINQLFLYQGFQVMRNREKYNIEARASYALLIVLYFDFLTKRIKTVKLTDSRIIERGIIEFCIRTPIENV